MKGQLGTFKTVTVTGVTVSGEVFITVQLVSEGHWFPRERQYVTQVRVSVHEANMERLIRCCRASLCAQSSRFINGQLYWRLSLAVASRPHVLGIANRIATCQIL